MTLSDLKEAVRKRREQNKRLEGEYAKLNLIKAAKLARIRWDEDSWFLGEIEKLEEAK
jgi:hypothetical protein